MSSILLLLAAVLLVVAADDPLMVNVQQGTLRGHQLVSRGGRQFAAFQGVPYARPPIGDLRFRGPQTPEPWTDVRDATKDGAVCLQRMIMGVQTKGEEDCLYLNVYTPQLPGTEPGSLLPVMVWIHGGGWVDGNGGSALFGPDYLMDKDVVLVSINYRLGALGFLSTEDATCPGNFGLKDQVAALRWVRDNIARFGGDPATVTIFGNSAGGASVHYLMMSPLAEGLIHRAISESGSAFALWAEAPEGLPRKRAEQLAEHLDCPVTSHEEMIACMRKKEAGEFLGGDRIFMEWSVDPVIPFRPVIERAVADGEEAFLPDDAHHLWKQSSQRSNVPWMTGINSADGAIMTARIYCNEAFFKDFQKEFDNVLPISVQYKYSSPAPEEVTRRIRDFYLGGNPVDNYTLHAVNDIFTDGMFLHALDEAVRVRKDLSDAPTYAYYFDYRGESTFITRYFQCDPSLEFGVNHEDELQYLFTKQNFFPGSSLSKNDEKIVDLMTTLWTNFAKTGSPTPGGSGVIPETWHPVESDILEHLHITERPYMDYGGFLEQRANFWADLPLKEHVGGHHKDEL